MRTDDFDYYLPQELIAQKPAWPRDSCRLMVLDRRTGEVEDRTFTDIIDYLDPGDLLVANDTKVVPARLLGHKAETGGAAEVLLLRRRGTDTWEALVRPGRRLKPGAVVEITDDGTTGGKVILRVTVLEHDSERGGRIVRLEPVGAGLPASDADSAQRASALEVALDSAIHQVGHMPLPPYITQYTGDDDQYQTVYATHEGSAAAPTAGLHFTPGLLSRIQAAGVRFVTVDLEVGVDTFRLVDEDDPTKHEMHTERYSVSPEVCDLVERTHAAGKRVIAVGTTSTRSLESAWSDAEGRLVPRDHEATSLYILPGYQFHVIDALITNFHVPRSTLMMLVSALAGREHIMAAYQQAIDRRYRFFSFGDAMLIK